MGTYRWRGLCASVLLSCVSTLSLSAVAQSQTPSASVPSSGASELVISGEQVISSSDLNSIANLTVSPGSSAIIDFSNNGTINLSGNITNAGSIYAFSTNPAVSAANFQAFNIFNNAGALMSTTLPSSFNSAGSGTLQNLNLSLTAVNNIVNAGTITSTSNLSLAAGNSITNEGIINAANINILAGPAGLINSGNITAMTGNLSISNMPTQNLLIANTSGALQALLGNISINALSTAALNGTSQALSILNNDGVIEALNGVINVQTSSAAELGATPKTNISGGNLLSQELNFISDHGYITINSNVIEGQLNATAGEVHVTASTPNLIIGEMKLSGDPTYWNTAGDISIGSNLGSASSNLSLIASGDIVTTTAGLTIDVSSTFGNAGSILMIAGANITTPSSGSKSNDSTTVITIGNKAPIASTTGGKIDLNTNAISSLTTTTTNGDGGSVTLIAFYGTGTNAGTITLPSTLTITTGTSSSTGTALNGNVTMIAGAPSGNAISIGSINTSGNTVNPQTANNGMVNLISSTPTFWGNPTTSSTNSLLVQGQSFTDTTITLPNAQAGSIGKGSLIAINPLGGNGEIVSVIGVPLVGPTNTIITITPLTFDHTVSEAVYIPADSLVVDPVGTVGSVSAGLPVTAKGGIILPTIAGVGNTTLQSGNITVAGSITANNEINILTSPTATAGNGAVQLQGSMSLTMNLDQTSNPIVTYQSFPAINITGTTVTVSSSATISSQIGTTTTPANIPNTITITTKHLTNNGVITGGAANSSPFSNSYIHVKGAGGVTSIDGSGSFSVPGYSVIEFSALDGDKLLMGATGTLPTISAGTGSVVILNAQGSTGVVKFQPNQTLSVSGGPIISINSPSLYMSDSSQINASGASVIAISSGYSKDPLNITLAGTNPITITTATGGAIRMRATDGQNLNISALDTATLSLVGATARIATSGAGTVNIPYAVLSPSSYQAYLNPAGGIIGGEFQPYVGGYFTSLAKNSGISPKFVNFAGYTKGAVIAMLAPVAAEQQMQVLATYTQQYSASYVIEAAKQLGLRVSAGVFVDLGADGTNLAPNRTEFDTVWAISAAQKHGNVIDIVVGNEDIVAGTSSADPSASVDTLISTIQSVQALTSLPVTTRQTIGVLTGDVTNYGSMRKLLNTVDGYIYGNVYPFFYFDVNSGLTPGMSKSDFQNTVSKNMSSQFDAATTAFVNAQTASKDPVTSMPVLRVGETGWATELLSESSTGLGYAGSGLPIQSTEWAGWYYEAMQAWSATHVNATANNATGVVIGGYFGLYDEPWKGIDGGLPANLATSLSANANAGATSINTTQTLPTLTPQSVLINPNQTTQEVQNITSYGTLTLGVSALIKSHNSGEIVDAGHPEEPYFGIYSASGVFPNNAANNVNDAGNGYIFTLTGVTKKIPLPVYGSPLPPVTPPTPSKPAISIAPIDTGLTASILAAGLAATSSINSINSSLSSTPGIIVPTDINPELPSETSESSILSAVNANNNVQLFQGAAQFSPQQLGLNPAESLITFSSHELLLAPDHPLTVNANLASVQIDAGAAVMLLQSGNELAIFALHDDHSGAVRVSVDGQSMEIPVGRQLVLTRDHDSAFEKVNPTAIGYRNISEGKLGSLKAYTSEFSMLSAISSTRTLRPLLKSASKEERELIAKLLKTAAAMSMVGKTKVPFKASR